MPLALSNGGASRLLIHNDEHAHMIVKTQPGAHMLLGIMDADAAGRNTKVGLQTDVINDAAEAGIEEDSSSPSLRTMKLVLSAGL